MKIKDRPNDFKVLELLDEAYLERTGDFRVYRVTKRKLTSLEAASHLATLAGVARGDVGMAGLKDRQGVTVQYMSVEGGRPVELDEPELKIAGVGFASQPMQSSFSRGNGFKIIVRDAPVDEFDAVLDRADFVSRHGVPNYFDEQRFGNLTHGQGWIALDLMRGRPEQALHVLLTQVSEDDHPARARFKRDLARCWGDWSRCFDVAKRNGEHHSIFEYLRANPRDFAGAFRHVATRIRLIHLYAYQSHVWNRAVVGALRRLAPPGSRRTLAINEGRLLFPTIPVELPRAWRGAFRLPGEGLEDVTDDDQHQLLSDVLSGDRVTPPEFRIEGVPGFRFKGEDRSIFVHPRGLRVEARARDEWSFSFELPRGAYATLVLRALCGSFESGRPRQARQDSRGRGGDGQRSGGGPRSSGRYRDEGSGGGRSRDDRSGGGYRSGGRTRDDRPGGGYRSGGRTRDDRSGGGYRSGRNHDDRSSGGSRSGGRYRDDRSGGGSRPGGRYDDRSSGGGSRPGGRYDDRSSGGGSRSGGRSRDDRSGGGSRSGGRYDDRPGRGSRSGGRSRDERSGGRSRDDRPGSRSRDDRSGGRSRDDRPGGRRSYGDRSGGGHRG